MSEVARDFWGEINNARPQETVEVGLVEGIYSSKDSGDGGEMGRI